MFVPSCWAQTKGGGVDGIIKRGAPRWEGYAAAMLYSSVVFLGGEMGDCYALTGREPHRYAIDGLAAAT